MTWTAIRQRAEEALSGSLGKSGSSSNRGSKGLAALFRKELSDHLNSRRLFLVFALLLLATTASLAGAVSSLREAESGEGVFLQLSTTSSSYIYSFATFLAFLGPLAGIALGFDAINNERNMGTLNRLAAQPIYRDSIINAKFLAAAAAEGMMVLTLGLYVSGMGILLLGVHPTVEEALRVVAFLVLAWVYMAFWLALSILFSVVCRHTATAALSVLAIWLFLTLFMSLVAGDLPIFSSPQRESRAFPI